MSCLTKIENLFQILSAPVSLFKFQSLWKLATMSEATLKKLNTEKAHLETQLEITKNAWKASEACKA
jgi:arginine/ornithine N-succinyltransferase beta subunit